MYWALTEAGISALAFEASANKEEGERVALSNHMQQQTNRRMLVKQAFLLLMVFCTFAAGADEVGEYDVPKTRPAVKKVFIDQNGAWSDHISSREPPEFCAAEFKLSESDVLRFFRIARKASLVEYTHTLDMSRCHAAGRAILRDGREVRWEIDKTRRGMITFSPQNSVYFYCKKCRNKLFFDE